MAKEKKKKEKVGIIELKDVVSFGVKTANALTKTLKDGKVTVTDVGYWLPALIALPKAVENIDKIPKEIKDIDSKEAEALIQQVANELEIDNIKAKKVIQHSLNIIYEIYGIVNAI